MSTQAGISSIAVAALFLVAGSFGSAAAATHTITIDAMAYSPATLHVKRGDTVVWVNKDPFPHTSTSKVGGFDSQTIAAGKSWTLTAAKKGTFAYTCTFHPTMKGTLRVN